MNKLTKAGIATAAGIALLMGGAGTLAYWNDGLGLDSGNSIVAGHLDLVSEGDGAWDQALDYIVPGDTVTYTETLTLSAVGDNLEFDLAADVASLTAFEAIDVTTAFEVRDASNAVVNHTASIGEGEYTVVVTVVVDFPATAVVNGDEDEDAVVALGDIEITVTQA